MFEAKTLNLLERLNTHKTAGILLVLIMGGGAWAGWRWKTSDWIFGRDHARALKKTVEICVESPSEKAFAPMCDFPPPPLMARPEACEMAPGAPPTMNACMAPSVGMAVAGMASAQNPARYNPNFNTEAYEAQQENAFLEVARNPLSTFSADVDTASYSNVRRFLVQNGCLPPKGAVRIEEMVNYFHYAYTAPTGGRPLAIHTELGACPWASRHRLLKIGMKGRTFSVANLPARNLVFLIDVSGSMSSPDKLPLVKQGLGFLVDQLRPMDRVAIVVYAGSSGLVLPSTSGSDRTRIRAAIDQLESGGSTQGSAGIELAYRTARANFRKDAINRVILATDGDFNVGVTDQDALVRLIEHERESGVFLSVLGVGSGNLKDSTMLKLADKGNGNYAYLDSLQEARKVFGEGGANLVTIAKDVKLQVEFNPRKVAWYRLVGYEKRILAAEDFNDDRKDAGDLGAGHTVTVLYELVSPGVPFHGGNIDALKYQKASETSVEAHGDELLTLKCRYKDPDSRQSQLLAHPVLDQCAAAPSKDFRFASSVAMFGLLLRDSATKGTATFQMACDLAQSSLGEDPEGERSEFVSLLRKAQALKAEASR